jgi:dolichyl-phosphate-mannose-protein mannosyltransferase
MATNTEFTTWPAADIDARYNDTLFEVEIDDAHEGQQWMTKSGHFRLVHVELKVCLWTHKDPPLPEWAFKQQEVNGNKNHHDRTNIWVVDDIIKDPSAFARAG